MSPTLASGLRADYEYPPDEDGRVRSLEVDHNPRPQWTGLLGPDGRPLARKREEIGFLPRRTGVSKHNPGIGWTGKLDAFLTWDRVKHG